MSLFKGVEIEDRGIPLCVKVYSFKGLEEIVYRIVLNFDWSIGIERLNCCRGVLILGD